MKCPQCMEITLVMAERQGVEIDYCPQCRGVWLDRGELDKLIERSTHQQVAGARPAPSPAPQGSFGYQRRKSWLSDIFD